MFDSQKRPSQSKEEHVSSSNCHPRPHISIFNERQYRTGHPPQGPLPLDVRGSVLILTQKNKGRCRQLLRRPFDIKSRWQSPYLDVGLNQVKATPLVGRSVLFSNSVRTAVGQVMSQRPELVERLEHMPDLFLTLLMSK
jgi:hypothetical protein